MGLVVSGGREDGISGEWGEGRGGRMGLVVSGGRGGRMGLVVSGGREDGISGEWGEGGWD